MMLGRLLVVLSCMTHAVGASRWGRKSDTPQAGAPKGRVDTDRQVSWWRRPLAVGALSGYRFGPEPYLLEFHGANCDHCDAMKPFMAKLFKEYRLMIKRHMVWEGTSNFRTMAIYDMETGCKGLPFFYNRRTNQTICGATTWSNFRKWAMNEKCEAFLPPMLSQEEEEEAKPKKLEQDSLLTKLKAKRGRKPAKSKKPDGYE